MRKALEFPRIDEGKLDAVEALIAAIADKEPGTAGAELEDLAALTGKVHTDVEFAEYWSWTDLDTLGSGSHWRRNRPVSLTCPGRNW